MSCFATTGDHFRYRVLVKGDLQRVWAYHDGVDLGGPALARVSKQFGYTLEQLRGM